MTRQQLLAAKQVDASANHWTVASENGTVPLKDFPAITNERYRLYQQL